MNRLVIPSILAATVLVAGMFAFMPVDKASTVHTTIQAATTDLTSVTKIDDDAPLNNIETGDAVSVTCTQPFIVRTVQIDISNTVAAGDITGTFASDADGATADFASVNILTGVNVGLTSENVLDAALPASGTVTVTFTEAANDTNDEALTASFIIEVTGSGTCS